MTDRRTRVVVIDGDVAFAEAMGLAMSLTPHLDVVGRATNADNGYRTVMDNAPDLVISDYRLRDSDSGIECARRLRRDGYQSPIVILTGYLAPQVQRETDSLSRGVALSKGTRLGLLVPPS